MIGWDEGVWGEGGGMVVGSIKTDSDVTRVRILIGSQTSNTDSDWLNTKPLHYHMLRRRWRYFRRADGVHSTSRLRWYRKATTPSPWTCLGGAVSRATHSCTPDEAAMVGRLGGGFLGEMWSW